MTQQIKPKQCGETAWYIPNQKGFVPEIGSGYFIADGLNKVTMIIHYGDCFDYAAINEGNCFETYQEAIDAFVKPVDPTPLTWDELIKLDPMTDVSFLGFSRGQLGEWIDLTDEVRAFNVTRKGRLNFEVNKYWRSKESLEAWIEQQKEI